MSETIIYKGKTYEVEARYWFYNESIEDGFACNLFDIDGRGYDDYVFISYRAACKKCISIEIADELGLL